MKTKILLWSVVLLLTVGIAGDSSLSSESARQQVITLSDGTKLTLLGVTHGKRHVAPTYERLGTGNWIDSAKDATVVWIEAEHDPKRWPSYELLVSDEANTGCVGTEVKASSHVREGVEVQGFVLDAFPRWDREVILRVRPFGGDISTEQFVIGNPEHDPFSSWTPEPLPNTQSDGDFGVTLTNLVAGVPMPYYKGRNPVPTNDPADQCVRIAFGFQQNGQSVTNWRPWLVETSDAAGNHVRGRGVISDYPKDGIYDYPRHGETDGYFYRPGLWPDQSPWKVRMEFTRTSGFSDDEILAVTNIPVQPGSQQEVDDQWVGESSAANTFFAETTINGVHLKLFPGIQFVARSDDQKHITVLVKADPDPQAQGMRMTVLKATDDQNRDIGNHISNLGGGGGNYPFEPAVLNAKSINLTIALHKSRFVEFTVKPEKIH